MAQRVCFGCQSYIYDTHISTVNDEIWHDVCLKCHECQMVLRDTCFFKDSKLLCKNDYYRLYGIRCFSCQQGIYPEQYVRKQEKKIFHLSCLKCNHCSKEAATGEQLFVTQEGFYLCQRDYEQSRQFKKLDKEEKTSEQESDAEEKSPSSLSVNGDNLASDDEDDINKRRGPRTTIKAKQLEVLKSAFLATPKPSRHIREKLAQDTGLSMRVIQVWFQNRRSKERRVKQLSVQDARQAMRRNKLDNNANSINDMDFRFFQNGASNQIIHHSYNKLDQSQYTDYVSTNQNNPLQFQPMLQDDLLLTNDFITDPNNNELNLIDSLNQSNISRNDLNQSILASYDNL